MHPPLRAIAISSAIAAAAATASAVSVLRLLGGRLDRIERRQAEYFHSAEFATGVVAGADIAQHVPPRLRVVGLSRS